MNLWAHYIQSEPLRGFAYFYSNVYSEDGKIQPTTTIFSSRIRKFDDVVKEVDEKKPRNEWESFLEDENRHKEDFIKVTIGVLNSLYENQESVEWPKLWGAVNNKLDPNSLFKDGKKSSGGYSYPDENIIKYAENKLAKEDNDLPFILEKMPKKGKYDKYKIIKKEPDF